MNAKKHGAYLQRWDFRTREGKAIREIQAELATALGGDPSPQEILLIQRASIKAIRCALAEAQIVGGSASKSLEEDYLRWSKELRSDLTALGLKRRPKKIQDLGDYIEENYGK